MLPCGSSWFLLGGRQASQERHNLAFQSAGGIDSWWRECGRAVPFEKRATVGQQGMEVLSGYDPAPYVPVIVAIAAELWLLCSSLTGRRQPVAALAFGRRAE